MALSPASSVSAKKAREEMEVGFRRWTLILRPKTLIPRFFSSSFFLTWERRGIHREGEGEREGSPRVSSDFGREDQQVVGVGEDDHLLDVRPGEAREDHLLHPGRPQRHYFGTQRKAPGAHRPGSSSLRATRAHSEAGLGARKADQSHPHLLFLSCRRSRDS